ncbi:MAG TPA: CBS domain-containing protein [Planctomycetota bacterium]|jgi:CBS domain-containing protein|nr:histidine kinase [Planctomycetota bacterium]MDP6129502.1 CBS domain-containing protein [Planctomycetota bacterium]MDP7245224.1 CBS domain-containing protein [Planctomycetota bacterium]HJM40196.1 CBS domain-containing protein [Planctomycetota bacterium]|tara:strand:- start:24214 stop:24630 length:417 start_codon:yes stop_codon:yes gene_type:complete
MSELRSLVGKQKRVVFVEPSATVRDASKAMAQANVGCTAVMEGSHLAGLFTERDILKRVLLNDLDVDEVQVSDVMTLDIVTTQADMDIRLARILMREHHIRHLPVLEDDGTLLGVLSIRDLVLEEIEEVKRYLHLEEG